MTLVEHGGEQALFVIGGFSEREYRADVYKLDITPGEAGRQAIFPPLPPPPSPSPRSPGVDPLCRSEQAPRRRGPCACLPPHPGSSRLREPCEQLPCCATPPRARGLTPFAAQMMTPRLGHTTCLVRQRLLIFGGSLKGSALDNDLYEFNPSAWRLATGCRRKERARLTHTPPSRLRLLPLPSQSLAPSRGRSCTCTVTLHAPATATLQRCAALYRCPHRGPGPLGSPVAISPSLTALCPACALRRQVVEGVRPKMFIVGGLGAPRGKPELLNDVFVYDVGASSDAGGPRSRWRLLTPTMHTHYRPGQRPPLGRSRG